MFKSLFFSFKQCIEAFKQCRPILFIDGTFFYGKYKMVLLTIKRVDGDDKIFLVAFEIVQKENNENWEYFM
ncbi:hypothetical protein J0J30_23645, partial [Vibrio vulnificus]|nr:hypothetical protein [Vibrio vulnificus]